MNILVTGANGQLGQCIKHTFRNTNNHKIFYADHKTLDILNSDEVYKFVSENEIDIIVNCAAYTNVDKAEDDQISAYELNCVGPKILSNAIKTRGGLLIHISTDYVFDNDVAYNEPISQDEKVSLTQKSIYGKTKYEGEIAIQNSGCKYVIVRTSWLYSEYGKNFVKTMMNLLATKEEINVVFDQIGTPTYGNDLALYILCIINSYTQDDLTNINKIYHYSNEGVCSWYDFAQAIKHICGFNCKVHPCKSSEFKQRAHRPHYSVLDKTFTKNSFDIEIPYWTNSLQKCIKNIIL